MGPAMWRRDVAVLVCCLSSYCFDVVLVPVFEFAFMSDCCCCQVVRLHVGCCQVVRLHVTCMLVVSRLSACMCVVV